MPHILTKENFSSRLTLGARSLLSWELEVLGYWGACEVEFSTSIALFTFARTEEDDGQVRKLVVSSHTFGRSEASTFRHLYLLNACANAVSPSSGT